MIKKRYYPVVNKHTEDYDKMRQKRENLISLLYQYIIKHIRIDVAFRF